MAAEQVQYTLSLKDLFTGNLKLADEGTKHFEGSVASAQARLGGLASAAKSAFGMIGVGFAIYKGVETIKEGIEKVHQLHQAQAQVEAGLESTGHAAGVTGEELKKMAAEFSSRMKYSKSDLTAMQSVLLTFPSVTKETFGTASQAIADMSTRLGTDLQSSAIQVGKALQDPIHGITALRRVGVNFNEAQTEMVKNMVATGKTAQAQAFILKELQTEFGGSAEAAAKADPLFKYNKAMGSVKMAIGEAAVEIQEALAPALMVIGNLFKWVATGIKDTVEFLKEHSDVVKAVAIGVGVAAAAYGAYLLVVNTVSIATQVWTGIQWLLNAALTANPIGIVIAAIGTLVAAVVYCYGHFAKFRAFLWATWEIIKEVGSIIGDFFMGLKDVLVGTFTLDTKQVERGMLRSADAVLNSGKRIAEAAKKGWDAGMADFNKEQKDKSTANAPKKVGGKAAAVTPTTQKETGKAHGQKNTTITVNIGSLVKEFKVNTTNLMDGAAKIQELVTQALVSATNDAQMIAGS